jgi:hypothetical protein
LLVNGICKGQGAGFSRHIKAAYSGRNFMKLTHVALALVASVMVTGAARAATTDDVKWINQCVADNKGEPGATPEIALKYCTCMNNKMDNNETQSISTWEKSHKTEQEACSKQAGWK